MTERVEEEGVMAQTKASRSRVLRTSLRIVFYQEGGRWIAHCLEFDLLGDGATKDEAVELLVQAIVLQFQFSLEHNNPANLFAPADGKYFRMFAEGKDIEKAVFSVDIVEQLRSSVPIIKGVETREYEDADSELALA